MAAVALTLASVGIAGAGCAAFSGEEDDAPPAGTNPEAGSAADAPGAADGPVVIGQPGPLAVTVTDPVRIQQGGSVKVRVKVERGAVPGDVTVRAESLPEGVSSKELVLPEGKSEGDVEINATASVQQGPVATATMIARARDGRANGAKLDLFVRGAPGSRDTTFGVAGTLDLGTVPYSGSAISDKHMFVMTNVLQRYDRTGALDTTYTPDPAATGGQLAPGPNDSLFVRSTSARHLFANGSLDTAYGNGGVSPVNPILLLSSIFANSAGELLVWGTTNNQQSVKAVKITSTGVQAPEFNFAEWKRPGSLDHVANVAHALPDGTFLAAMTGSKPCGASLLHILADGSLDSAFAQGAGYGDIVLSSDGTASGQLSSSALRPTGLFLLAWTNRYERYMVLKFGLDGVPDATFGDAASPAIALSLTTHTLGQNTSAGMDVDAQGRIVLATKTKVAGAESMAIQRLTPQGAADATFGANGFVTFPSDAATLIRRVFVADSERILVIHLTASVGGNALISRFWM